MVYRVMQIFVPQSSDEKLDELLEGHEILGRWRDTDAGQIVLHLLVPAEETEPIMDRFEQQYADAKGFHVILFPVEAVSTSSRGGVRGRQGGGAGQGRKREDWQTTDQPGGTLRRSQRGTRRLPRVLGDGNSLGCRGCGRAVAERRRGDYRSHGHCPTVGTECRHVACDNFGRL